ncbi:M20/M25/M40 family metallo-hydrolase [Lacrimispora celerecrescens]|uniref:Putative aminopeptidase FrvX n=1 Tax=[Clostridium] celerecrescens 18A TaxID=1286362 RepID=A0A2M8Z4R0_9FIRM|nr:M20/M25/M40 family metallo-hydrolase [Lacrimispora celerecrescens]PJJ28426.1 putative aminopeptidase FrvX [[Clostridium] celerecrescens 18A]
MDKEFLKELCEAKAVASNERRVRDVLRKNCTPYAQELAYDGLGSIIFTQGGEGPSILLAAHMDEVGFLVRSISSQGMVMVLPVGNVRTFSSFMQEVTVTTAGGREYKGILNAVYDEGKKEATGLYVDMGQDGLEEVMDLGVQPGDMVTFSSVYREYENGRFAARALDDRAGCWVMGELMKRMDGNVHPNRISYAFTSSEEVGTRGAKTAARVVLPDICIVLDAACSGNEFVRDHTNNRQIGKGPMIVHYDKTVVSNRAMVELVRRCAKELDIHVQDDMFLNGGTDGGVLHQDGTGHPAVVLGIPTRYGHSPYSIACYRDMEQMVDLLECLLIKLDKEVCRQIGFEAEVYEV